MIVYEKCPGIGDVTKFLNKNGMSLQDVTIVYGSINRCGGSYFVLYDDGKAPAAKKAKAAPDAEQEAGTDETQESAKSDG